MKKNINIIINTMDIIMVIQSILLLIKKEIDIGVVFTVITLVLTGFIYLTELKIKRPVLQGQEKFCVGYIIIITILFSAFYLSYSYVTFNNIGSFPNTIFKIAAASLIYIVLIIPAKFIDPKYARKVSGVPVGTIIALALIVYITGMIDAFRCSVSLLDGILVIFFGPIAIAIIYFIPFLLSLGASIILNGSFEFE